MLFGRNGFTQIPSAQCPSAAMLHCNIDCNNGVSWQQCCITTLNSIKVYYNVSNDNGSNVACNVATIITFLPLQHSKITAFPNCPIATKALPNWGEAIATKALENCEIAPEGYWKIAKLRRSHCPEGNCYICKIFSSCD